MQNVTHPGKAIGPRMVAHPPQRVVREKAAIAQVLPLVVVVYSFLLFPVEVKLTIAGLNLYSYRLAILVMLPISFLLTRHIRFRATIADILVLIASAWMITSFIYHYGPGTGLVRSASLFIDSFGAYLIARMSISNFNDLRRLLIMIIPGLAISGGLLMFESVTKTLVVRPFFARIFGSATSFDAGTATGALEFVRQERLGLLRAYSVFSYPILAGVMLGSLIPLYAMSGLRSWPLYAGIGAALLGFFSISSATFVALGMGAGFVIADRILPLLRPITWSMISWLLLGYAFLANLALESGIVGVVSRFTLNPGTAYVRRMQWFYGGQEVIDNPVFGIGFAAYRRPDWLTAAIDAHFLALGIKHGLVTPVLLFVVAVGLVIGIGRLSSKLPRLDRNMALSVNFMMIILLFASMTVTFFAEANVFFMLALGIAGSSYMISRQIIVDAATRRPMMAAGPSPQRPTGNIPQGVRTQPTPAQAQMRPAPRR